MKIIYTNISPVTLAYTNINHIFYLYNQKPQKVYLCVWDNFVYESELLSSNNNDEKKTRLKANVAVLEKLMSHLGISYNTIYLSEMWERIFRNPEVSKIYQKILSKISLNNIKEGFQLEYIPFGNISISMINYIIVDYLISIYLPEIAPELCNSQPTHYLTSERFKAFQEEIDHTIKNISKYSPPKSIFVSGVPVIIHPEQKIIPSMDMSPDSIKRICDAYYNKKIPNEKEFYDMCNVFSPLVKDLSINGSKGKIKPITNYEKYLEFMSKNLYRYFEEVNKIASNVELKKQNRCFYITNHRDFHKNIKNLNKIKLNILKNCNGENSVSDISKKTGLKLSTVSQYVSMLREKNILDDARKPKRLIDNFVINLEGME